MEAKNRARTRPVFSLSRNLAYQPFNGSRIKPITFNVKED
jgi:hypothetical protein